MTEAQGGAGIRRCRVSGVGGYGKIGERAVGNTETFSLAPETRHLTPGLWESAC